MRWLLFFVCASILNSGSESMGQESEPPPPPPDLSGAPVEDTPFEFRLPEQPSVIDRQLYEDGAKSLLIRPGDFVLEFKGGTGGGISQYPRLTGKAGMESNIRIMQMLDLNLPLFVASNFSDFGLIQLTPGLRFAVPFRLHPYPMSGFVTVGSGAYVIISDGEVPFTDIGLRIGAGMDFFYSLRSAFTVDLVFNQIVSAVNREFKFVDRGEVEVFLPASLDLMIGIKYAFTDKTIERP